jgi:ETC complex I subunit conserved region
LRLLFDTKEEAIAYCERNGIAYQLFESPPLRRPRISYSDNFAYTRRTPWTH